MAVDGVREILRDGPGDDGEGSSHERSFLMAARLAKDIDEINLQDEKFQDTQRRLDAGSPTEIVFGESAIRDRLEDIRGRIRLTVDSRPVAAIGVDEDTGGDRHAVEELPDRAGSGDGGEQAG